MNDFDDYPEITQRDMKRATLRLGLKPVSRKQKVTIQLDRTVVEYFKRKAGESEYQALINDALRRSILQELDEKE